MAELKEEAIKVHDRVLERVREQDLVVYTDGSLMDGYSGAGV